MLKSGDKIPHFNLLDQNGNEFDSKDVIGVKNCVIYFYPKDETKVCTAQACSFRDNYEDFLNLGAEVIGISSDDQKSHEEFAKRHNLPFTLLSDENKDVRKAFGVPNDLLGLIPGRYTYIINKSGVILEVFNSAFNAEKHVEEALKTLKSEV